MKLSRSVRVLVVPILALSSFTAMAHADEVYVSSFPGGVVTGTVNAELIVDRHCIIAPGAYIKGDIKQEVASANWNIMVLNDARVDGNIIEYGGGLVGVVVGSGHFFNGNIKEEGVGHVIVYVLSGGLFDGNVEENGWGGVAINVQGSGLFNGNAYENGVGNMTSFGSGRYNGSTKGEGPGSCSNSIQNFNGSPCE